VTPAVGILALLLSASRPPLAVVSTAERLPLPPGVTRVEARPFDRTLVLHGSRAATAQAARRLARASRICPGVALVDGAVVLRCPTERVRAQLDLSRDPAALDLFRLTIPPWRAGEEPPPLVPFDVEALGLGPCPGATPAARGECAFARGDAAAARRHFEEATAAGYSPLASLRLGDLALQADDLDEAVAHWRRARGEAPWARLAEARLCEADPRCLDSDQLDAIFDASAVVFPLRADVVLRRERLRALSGGVVAAARTLARETERGGACERAHAWCRHVLATALTRPGTEGAEALAIYLDTPGHDEGPDALALARAAAGQAAAAGAPEWAASLLASMTGRVPAAGQAAHLARVARLFLDGGDRVRAEEIVRFAATRLSPSQLARPEWAALRRAVAPPRGARKPASGDGPDPDLEAARAALEAARLATLRKGASR
jgi:tetratricopeptide (TPR) repeat protein